MCSATGYPVAERPAYTRGENRFSTIVPSLAVTGCSSINSRRELSTGRRRSGMAACGALAAGGRTPASSFWKDDRAGGGTGARARLC